MGWGWAGFTVHEPTAQQQDSPWECAWDCKELNSNASPQSVTVSSLTLARFMATHRESQARRVPCQSQSGDAGRQ
jgi:hypothetical protein